MHRFTRPARALLCLAVIAGSLAGCPAPNTCVSASACGSDPCVAGAAVNAAGVEAAAWELLFDYDTMDNALFGVWGTGPNDVWTVGATAKGKPEFGPEVLHFDGKVWKRFKTGAKGELWWVTGLPSGSMWMAGSGGTIVRRTGAQFEVIQAPDTTQLFGIWASSESDAYAVGGPPACLPGAPCGVIWHWDGKTWGPAPGLTAAQRNLTTWFKVWGRSANDVWVVGGAGKILHWDGKIWTEVPSGTTDHIFTIHGNDKLLVAVGGMGSGVLLENTGSGFHPAKIQGDLPGLNGVWVSADGRAVAVGASGTVWRRCGDTWLMDGANILEGLDTFHGVWQAAAGDVFAVGGGVMAPPFRGGQIAHFGSPTHARTIAE